MILPENENFVSNLASKETRMLEEASVDEATNCLLKFWTTNQLADPHCNSAWDTFYCWPTTPANQMVSIPCFKIIQELDPHLALINASAYRICDENGEWLWGNWTNYTECAILLDSIEEELVPTRKEMTATVVSYIGFIGSLISLVSLAIALFIFCYFKSLQCNRLSVHKNFVVSLIMRFVLMIIVTEPSISGRRESFISVEWLCKLILALKMYSMLSNVNWMFVEGFYLHSRITVSVFNTEAPFGFFYLVGWGLPFINIVVWVIVMQTQTASFCWLGYSKSMFIWILTAPMSFALLINFLFLINIVRILVTKLRANSAVETAQANGTLQNTLNGARSFEQCQSITKSRNISSMVATRKAIKATAVLFPLLGTTNLLFFVNPKDNGHLEDAYIIINTILQSSQGIFVAVLYCFLNSEVRSAIGKKYVRLMLQRNPNSRRFARRKYSRTSSFFLSQHEPPEK